MVMHCCYRGGSVSMLDYSEWCCCHSDGVICCHSDGSGSLRRQPPSKPTRSTSATEDNTGPADDSVAQQPQSPSPAQVGSSIVEEYI